MEKILTLFALPRTGSSWIYSILEAHFLETKEFDLCFDGFFNKNHYFKIDSDGRWRTLLTYEADSFHFNYHLGNDDEIIKTHVVGRQGTEDLRLDILKNTRSHVFLKEHPNQLTESELRYLKAYPHIFLERRDRWQQLLSYLLALYTNSFIINKQQKTVNIEPLSLMVDLLHVTRFCAWVNEFNGIKNSGAPVYYYEDLLEDLTPLLSAYKITSTPQNPPLKQDYGNKERYFANLAMIRKVYEDYKWD